MEAFSKIVRRNEVVRPQILTLCHLLTDRLRTPLDRHSTVYGLVTKTYFRRQNRSVSFFATRTL